MPENKVIYSSIEDVPNSQWEKLNQQKIYFAHQSVGMNIINGIEAIMKETPAIRLSIKETTGRSDFKKGIFAHSMIGKNLEPVTKIEAFHENLKNNLKAEVDIAALKLCYVDINEKTDINALFQKYRTDIDAIKSSCPDMVIVHFTSPLTTIQTGPKAWIKKVIGRALDGVDSNIRRSEYNALLKAEYLGKDPVFDIAGIESTLPDGTKTMFDKNGKAYEHLAPVYSADGGHLNEAGSRHVAEQLLLLLVNLV